MIEVADEFKLSIGQVVIQFVAGDGVYLEVTEPHTQFVVSEGKPDITLKVHYGSLPPLGLEEKIFESGGIWDLYRSNGRFELTLSAPAAGPEPYRVAVINSDFTSGDLYTRLSPDRPVDSPVEMNADGKVRVNPTMYPLDEVLVMHLLSFGRGVELHSCGVVQDGHGLLFTGVSGAGKSTLANLWKKRHVQILSDDRIIVRQIDGRFWMFGTPWHGDAKTSLAQGAPLEKICLIKHSPENYALPLEAKNAVSTMMVRCFPAFWSESGLLHTLDVLSQITEQVPCYELGFVPDESILDFINGINS